MPTYEYECEACQDVFETSQKISAEPLRLCTKCGKEALRRKVGGGSAILQFKGSGFYITDYSRKDQSSSGECCPCGSKKSCDSKE